MARPKVVLPENGITEEDLLVHDAQDEDPTMHQMLARLRYPMVTGIIRSFNDVTLGDREDAQTREVKANSKFSKADDLFFAGDTYQVD